MVGALTCALHRAARPAIKSMAVAQLKQLRAPPRAVRLSARSIHRTVCVQGVEVTNITKQGDGVSFPQKGQRVSTDKMKPDETQ